MATTGAQRVYSVFKVKAEGRTRLVVFDTQDLTLGRSPENDLAIDDPEISRKHCVFKRTPSGCLVEDVGTANGTVVNGESIDHVQLSHGDIVSIGQVEITYAETSRNPGSLGPSVEYASQLKSFRAPGATGGDGDATILGLMDTVSPGDEAFEVRPAGDFDFSDLESAGPARDLDAELQDLEADPVEDLHVGDADPAPAGKRPASAATEPPASADIWELDDEDGLAPPKTGRTGRFTLSLEIEGLEGELRRVVDGLAGKLLELPPLRVRIKGEDLG